MSLTHLNIQQSNTLYERIAPRDLINIYNAYKTGNLDRSSVIKGAIVSSYGYKTFCDELTTKYKQLKIDIGEYYTEWDDKEFQRLISLLHGDGYGIMSSDLNKVITLSTNALSGNIQRPFYGNKIITTIDMRPFKNFRYQRTTGTNSNLCVVNWEDSNDAYALKNIYISSISNGQGFTPFSFIQEGNGQSSTYFLDKVWFEGYESTSASTDQIYGHAGNYNRCCIDHFYWLNHNQGLGTNSRHEFTMTDGTSAYYLDAGSGNWNSRGSYMNNIILDSPIPILIGSHSWGNGKWGSVTKLWVPDDQLDYYNYIYQTYGERPGNGISTISNYNSEFRTLANWWKYPGKVTYQPAY